MLGLLQFVRCNVSGKKHATCKCYQLPYLEKANECMALLSAHCKTEMCLTICGTPLLALKHIQIVVQKSQEIIRLIMQLSYWLSSQNSQCSSARMCSNNTALLCNNASVIEWLCSHTLHGWVVKHTPAKGTSFYGLCKSHFLKLCGRR
jgi:hypothetical protein